VSRPSISRRRGPARRRRARSPLFAAIESPAAPTPRRPVPLRVRVALDYWAAYPDEVEQQIRDADEAERVAEERWHRERRLLS
jgi:hypothetical protein